MIRLLRNWSLLLFDCAGNIFHPSMAGDLKNLTDSPSNLTHLDISGTGLGIGAAELAAHILCHPVCSKLWAFAFLCSAICVSILSCTDFHSAMQVPPLRFLNIGGNSIGDEGAAIVSAGLVEAAGVGLLMLRFIGLDNNSMCVMDVRVIVSLVL